MVNDTSDKSTKETIKSIKGILDKYSVCEKKGDEIKEELDNIRKDNPKALEEVISNLAPENRLVHGLDGKLLGYDEGLLVRSDPNLYGLEGKIVDKSMVNCNKR